MNEECLRLVGWIEKGALGLTAAFSLAGWALWGPDVAAGVAAGGVVGLANFKGLRRFAARAVVAAGKESVRGLAFVSGALRYLALSVVVWALVSSRLVDLVGLLVGLGVVSLAVIVAGLRHGLEASRSADVVG